MRRFVVLDMYWVLLCCWLRRYIEYCMHRVNMLRHYGVQPVLVFDGGSLPMKSDQEIKRARYDVYCWECCLCLA
jgi:methylmalonyl-CoA mutase cobalamin-binding subunit